MKKQYITISGMFVVLGAAVFLISDKKEAESPTSNQTQLEPTYEVVETSQAKPKKLDTVIEKEATPKAETIETQELTASDIEIPTRKEIEANTSHSDTQWKKDRGIFSEEDQAIYSTYEFDTLKELAANGDMLACQTLAWKFLEQKRIADIKSVLSHSMAYGDTEAMAILSSMYDSIITSIEDKTLSMEDALKILNVDAKDASVERVVRLQQKGLEILMRIRGDTANAEAMKISLSREVKEEFTPAELEYSKEFAFDYYRALVELREDIGLDKFDNSQMESFGGQESDLYLEYLSRR